MQCAEAADGEPQTWMKEWEASGVMTTDDEVERAVALTRFCQLIEFTIVDLAGLKLNEMMEELEEHGIAPHHVPVSALQHVLDKAKQSVAQGIHRTDLLTKLFPTRVKAASTPSTSLPSSDPFAHAPKRPRVYHAELDSDDARFQ